MTKQTKELYSYPTDDGRIAISQQNLAYAVNEEGNLVLASVRGDDAATINLIADPTLAVLISKLYTGYWQDPAQVVQMSAHERLIATMIYSILTHTILADCDQGCRGFGSHNPNREKSYSGSTAHIIVLAGMMICI